MNKVDYYKRAIEKLGIVNDTEYMSTMDNWCIVHATKYLPRQNSDNTMYIPSTAMATNYEDVRSTVHVALNHVVQSHGAGSWDDTPIIVLVPYNDVVKQNGNPVEIAGTDTYWSVDPDRGLVLPDTAYVVKPDNNGPLYNIDEHSATYKRDNYTEDEVAFIESRLNSDDFDKYMKYKNSEFTDGEIKDEFLRDKRVKHLYDTAKDKKAFLRGLFEEARFDVLSKCLRDMVTKEVMQNLGFEYIDSIKDASETSRIIADVAKKHDIAFDVSNKGHSVSLYSDMENQHFVITRILYGVFSWDVGLLKTTDLNVVYDTIAEYGLNNSVISAIVANIIDNKPIDFDKMYQDCYANILRNGLDTAQNELASYEIQIGKYIDGAFSGLDDDSKNREINKLNGFIDDCNKFIEHWSGKNTIAEYDNNLAKTLHRHCDVLSGKYNKWHEQIVNKPEYSVLVQKLRGLVAMQNIQLNGRDFL